ncbi:MAG: DUF5131 family protein [Anaerolineae bacterium]
MGAVLCAGSARRLERPSIAMSANTAIAWTESTWNPLTGCAKISPGVRCRALGPLR